MKLVCLNIAALSLGILLAGCSQQPTSDHSSSPDNKSEAKPDRVKVKAHRFGYDSKTGWYSGDSNLDILIRDGQVWLESEPGKSGPGSHSQARISAEGDLVIDEKPVALDAGQRALTQRYFKQITRIRAQADASGDAGVAFLRNTIGNVADAFVRRNPDQVGKAIETDANSLRTNLDKLCKLVAAIKDTQDSIVAAIPAFEPFATISHGSECT